MNISELCIRRPVMTVLLCMAAIAVGIFALLHIPVGALPSFNTPVISVTATFSGASPETMASSVALPLEKQFSSIEGLENISSVSTQGRTSITLEFAYSRDIDAAAVDVQAALLRAQRQLPDDMTSLPSYRKVNPAEGAVLILSVTSPSVDLAQLNDYAENLISPLISTINGVSQVSVGGQKRYAVRVRANLDVLNARNITLEELTAAVRAANAITPLGVLDGPRQTLTIQLHTNLMRAADFGRIIIAQRDGAPVRLDEVATVEDSFESLKTATSFNGVRSIALFVQRQPNANTVEVVDAVHALMPRLREQLPKSIDVHLVNDRSLSIRESLHDVYLTLAFTIALVIMVIFLFLHRVSATLIPALTIPISLLCAVALHYALGYSFNNISLLGITLAVGLVVDDAIVVLENIVRYMERGLPPLSAAVRGAREVGFTIISISLSLVAVFIPIFFMPGVIGLLFHEFAVVVGLSILASAVVSLTLVPMLTSRLRHDDSAHARQPEGQPPASDAPHAPAQPATRFGRSFEYMYRATHGAYMRSLEWTFAHRPLMLMLALATFAMTVWLFIAVPKGFFPEEDTGQIQVSTEAAEDTSFTAMVDLQEQVAQVFRNSPYVASVVSSVGSGSGETQNAGRLFIGLKPRSQRPALPHVLESMRRQFAAIAGISVYMTPVQNLRLGGRVSKSRYQYTLQSVSGTGLVEWSEKLMAHMRSDAIFRDVTSNALSRGLQATLDVDFTKAGTLGIGTEEVRSALYNAFGDREISTIYTDSDSYSVILSATEADRRFEQDMMRVSVRSNTGALVPLSAFTTVRREAGPSAVNHQGQLQAVTISFNLAPGASLGDATTHIRQYGQAISLPPTIFTSYGGDAAVFEGTQSSQIVLLVLAIVVIYILLGVLYESYIHPLTILAGLPSAAVGALLTLLIFRMDLTLIAIIGILMLIGIVKKNAIMMIDFALHAQRAQGMRPQDAMREACRLRFRPILMTTLAAMMGALPIALGLGAGAELRQPLGLAVVGGLLVSQVITLYITPAIYLTLDKFSGSGPLTGDLELVG